jgi:glutaredoxin 3
VPNVRIYTTNMCAYCERAKRLMRKHGLEFEEINMARDPDGRRKLVELTGMMTFPQIVIDDRVVGGYDQLAAELAAAA